MVGVRVDRISDSSSFAPIYLGDSLPEELFTSRLADAFRQLMEVSDRKSRKSQFLSLWEQLPSENRSVAYELLLFLVQVAANADLNKMNSENLGTVFGEMAQVPVRDGKVRALFLRLLSSLPCLNSILSLSCRSTS
jgi:hypothetical protein